MNTDVVIVGAAPPVFYGAGDAEKGSRQKIVTERGKARCP